MEGSLVNWAAILGSIATLAIAILTFFNIRIARSTLKLIEEREKRLQSSLQIYNIESFVKRDVEQDSRLYANKIGITCTSDTDNSVRDLSLRVYFKRYGEITSNISIPAMKTIDQRVRELVGIEANEIITFPSRIRAHEVVNGWTLFKISNEYLAGSRIENYQVILTDAQGIESYFEIKVMREM